MSIIKGTNQIVAGFGGTKRPLGEVYFSQSSLATDNPGALPGWTGEYYENGKTLFPDLYNFVKALSELQLTKAQYDSTIATYGECPKYVVDENGGTTTGTITVYGWLSRGSTFYTKARNPVAGDSVWPSTDTTQESIYTVISLSNDTLTFSGPTREWSGTYSTTTTGTGLVTTSGTSLRLPKYANYIKMANSTEGITQKGAGLPNVTGDFNAGGVWTRYASGAFNVPTAEVGGDGPNGNGSVQTRYTFDASRSSAIYGASDTVQPAHTTLYPWVVAYTSAIPASVAQAAEFQQALSGKADTNLGNVPSNYDYVVESYNDSTNWYRKYKSGWLEQGGQTPTVAGGATTTVTLLKPYNNAVYNVVVQPVGAYSPAGEANNVVPTRTTTNFIIACGQIATQAFSWRTEGQGAN